MEEVRAGGKSERKKRILNDNDTNQNGVKLIFKSERKTVGIDVMCFFFHRLRVDNEMSNFSGGNLCVSIEWSDMRY